MSMPPSKVQKIGMNRWLRVSPPRDKPWYHVLVDQSPTITYVAERNLEEDSSNQPILHPLVDDYFSRFEEGKYLVDVS